MMRRPGLFIAATSAAVALAGFSFAQTSPNTAPTQSAVPSSLINLTMADQHILKENLLKGNPATQGSANVKMEPGTRVPESIQLRPFPSLITQKVPQIKSHMYFVANGAIAIVQPQERKIVAVVK